MNVMENGYKNKMKKLDECTDVYLYEEEYKDHHCRLDLIVENHGIFSRYSLIYLLPFV